MGAMASPTASDTDGIRPSTSWSWLTRGRPPTTVAGAESAIVLLVIGIRIGTLVQMLPSLPRGISTSPRPALYAICWALAAASGFVVAIASFRRGRPLPDRWVAADVALAVVIVALGPITVSLENRVGSWEGFQLAYALSVIISATVIRSSRLWLAALAAVLLAEIWYLTSARASTSVPTILGNLLTVVVLVTVGRAIIHYLRRIAQDAEDAQVRAAELGRLQEEQRAQVAIHNGAAMMHLLADPDLDDATRDRLIDQAQREANRMRAYLRGLPYSDLDGDRTERATGTRRLADVVAATCREFDDLVIEVALDLGQGVVVEAEAAEAVRGALTSLLLNVRQHAGARLVVVHLDAGDLFPPTRWVLTVHDDGHGFDPGVVAPGVGLREVVRCELGRHGIEVALESAPGAGTTVTIEGAAAAAFPTAPVTSERIR